MSALEQQVGGDHYKKLGAYQPWEVLAKWMTPDELRGFMKGTVIAYLARERDKGGDADIAKALHTMQIYTELAGRKGGEAAKEGQGAEDKRPVTGMDQPVGLVKSRWAPIDVSAAISARG